MYAPAAMTSASQIDTRNQNFFRSPSRKILELYPLSRTHKKKGLKNPKKIFKYQLDFLSLEDRYQ